MASMLCSLCSYSMPAARAPLLRANAHAASTSLGFASSQLAGLSLGLTSAAAPLPVSAKHTIVARRICPFLDKRTNQANKVSFSNHKTKKQQFVNHKRT